MTGSIVALDRVMRRGIIRGNDGLERPFRRTGLTLWDAFDDLKLGDWVRFDEDNRRAINVEPLLGMPAE